MRNEMEAVLKEAFRELALKTRYERGLTQSKMSRAIVVETQNRPLSLLRLCKQGLIEFYMQKSSIFSRGFLLYIDFDVTIL